MTTSKLVSYITNFEVTSKTDDDFMKNIKLIYGTGWINAS